MRKMENIEYDYVIYEIEELIGKRFEKIQEIDDNKFSLKIGKERIVIELGVRINVAYTIESGESSERFVQKVRKELKGFKFSRIFKYQNDKIIVFEFEGFDQKKTLIFEMFAKGNAILVDEEFKILGTYKREKWADRETKFGLMYSFPKGNLKDNLKEVIKDAKNACVYPFSKDDKFKTPQGSVKIIYPGIMTCMMRLPLGKKYAKFILKGLGIAEDINIEKLKSKQIESIDGKIEEFKENVRFFGFFKDGKIEDFGLIGFDKYKEYEVKEFDKFSKVIDEYYESGTKTEKKSSKLKKLEKRLKKQIEQLKELKEKEKKYREIGDAIYSNYNKIEDILKDKKGKEIEIEI